MIFVVIVAVWAVYLVQHWVRRRDHLATARSVDRFSEAMRVLERRRALPSPDLSEPTPRSYSVSPLRPARPQVVVKRPAGATAVAPPPSYRRAKKAARLRAVALLAGSVTLVTLVALPIAGVLASWWVFVGIGSLVASLGVVRWSVSRERARRRAEARERARARTAAARPAAARPAAAQPVQQHVFARQSVAATTRTARRSVRTAHLYDVVEVEAALRSDPVEPDQLPSADVVVDAAEQAASGWQPVPVPPPTYTLKAKAVRGVATAPTGSAQLPADGAEMALDEEFEDLPRVESAG
ncbi:hypothetical protein GCM10011366_02660 [Ornithinimicrobium tianjinense]|uniref:Uncharacterized protein n=1 Tax=Ornithinimicrobium tianjinense TaxID=1195761 RepID=A0A917F0K4_9MICO|nr:hypothetical protein GCM10011366_02660 [Ornithinimicrobium tianjinense]